jgi:hypothetical protein
VLIDTSRSAVSVMHERLEEVPRVAATR